MKRSEINKYFQLLYFFHFLYFMIYKIQIKGIIWLIDLKNKKLIREQDGLVRDLNLERIEWFREYIETIYGRSKLIQ